MLLLRPEEWWRLRSWQWEKQRRHDRMWSKHRQRGFIINPYAFGVSGGDPYFSSVISLVHFDGTAGATPPYADQIANRSPGWGGSGPILAASPVKFGTACLNPGGVGVTNADHADWDFGSGDFTVEGWFYQVSWNIYGLFGKWVSGSYSPFLILELGSGVLSFWASTSGSAWDFSVQTASSTLANSTWFHAAICRSGSSIRGFLDGTQVGSTGTLTGAVMTNSTKPSIAAASTGSSPQYALSGNADECRATKGVARYTSNFSAPTTAFPDF